MNRGRPSKYDPGFCDLLFEHMQSGHSFESFASQVGVDRDTIYEWAKVHPNFSDAKKQGREAQLFFFERLGIEACKGRIEDFNGTAFVWLTKNMLGWKDKTNIEITGKDGGPVRGLTMHLLADDDSAKALKLLSERLDFEIPSE
jgi:hypothetical protein